MNEMKRTIEQGCYLPVTIALKGQKDQNIIVYSISISNVFTCVRFFVLMVGKIRFGELSNSADSF